MPKELAIEFPVDAGYPMPANANYIGTNAINIARLCIANSRSSGNWQFEQPVAMALPSVLLKSGPLSRRSGR